MREDQKRIIELAENRFIHEEKKDSKQNPKPVKNDYDKTVSDQPANYHRRVSELLFETKPYNPKDSYGGYGNRAGNYIENDKPEDTNTEDPISNIIKSVLNNEISYQNFFQYVTNNFNSFSVNQKTQILEGVLNAIDNDEEFKKIKELTD